MPTPLGEAYMGAARIKNGGLNISDVVRRGPKLLKHLQQATAGCPVRPFFRVAWHGGFYRLVLHHGTVCRAGVFRRSAADAAPEGQSGSVRSVHPARAGSAAGPKSRPAHKYRGAIVVRCPACGSAGI